MARSAATRNARKASTKNTPAVETPAVEETPAPKAKREPKIKTPRFTPLPAERAAWVAVNARPAVASCLCGCGGSTKGRFMPGHDATLKETLKAGAAAGCENSQAALATFGW